METSNIERLYDDVYAKLPNLSPLAGEDFVAVERNGLRVGVICIAVDRFMVRISSRDRSAYVVGNKEKIMERLMPEMKRFEGLL